ncbi:MBL fold metallo-hydrolase [bacterium]|nr:MBL fold metallo-hydrolase [bacterium]
MSFKTICLLFIIVWFAWFPKFYSLFVHHRTTARVVFCDVGQGDASLIVDGDFQLLIDGGPSLDVLSCLTQNVSPFDHELEWLVLTHADADHFYGLTSVLQTYTVRHLMIYNMAKASDDFYAFYQAVWSQLQVGNLEVVFPALGARQCLSSRVCVEVLSEFRDFFPLNIYQDHQSFENLSDMITKFVPKSYDYNNGSIVLKLYFDQFSFLFTGDAEEPQELAILDTGLLTKVDVLKSGHHGSKSSSSPLFLAAVQPENIVISCGLENSYGHPHQLTLQRYADLGAQVWRTDLQGTIVIDFDDNGYWHWSSPHSLPD